MGHVGRIARLAFIAGAMAAFAGSAAAQDVYRAGSSDPYWRVAIDAHSIRFEEPGRRPIVVPRPVAKTSAGGDRYEAKGLVVDTTRAHCVMGDSNREYRDMVIVEVGGRTLRGCGNGATGVQVNAMKVPPRPVARPPVAVAAAKPPPARPVAPVASAPVARPTAPAAPASAPALASAPPPPPLSTALELGKTRPALANTRWTVWKVRDQEMKTPQPLTVSFSGSQVEGQLCNRFRGGYTLTGERLQAASLASTRMACQGPATGAEQLTFAILRQATRATISKWGTLTLGNGRDTVMLRPVR